jgi:hypothetical protein
MLSDMMLCVAIVKCHNNVFGYAQCHYAECHYAECHGANSAQMLNT